MRAATAARRWRSPARLRRDPLGRSVERRAGHRHPVYAPLRRIFPRRLAALPGRGVRVPAAGGPVPRAARRARHRRRAPTALAFAACAGVLLAAAVLLLCGRLAARTGGDSAPRAMFAVALAPLLTGAMVRTHFDLVPGRCSSSPRCVLLARGPPAAQGSPFWALGVVAKGFPLVAAPVALAWLVGARRARGPLATPRWRGRGARCSSSSPLQLRSRPAGRGTPSPTTSTARRRSRACLRRCCWRSTALGGGSCRRGDQLPVGRRSSTRAGDAAVIVMSGLLIAVVAALALVAAVRARGAGRSPRPRSLLARRRRGVRRVLARCSRRSS